MLLNLGIWVSRTSVETGNIPGNPLPPPLNSFLLRAGGALFLRLSDLTSKIMRP